MPENIIEINKLAFSRGRRVIFSDVSFHIPKGKIIGVLGPSGTGKTTLLKLIGGQLKPDSGDVNVFSENVSALKRDALYQMRRRMGMLFQSGALFTNISVFENVAFPLREHTNLPEELIRDCVLMKLEAVGLRGARDLMPSELSGGMARRVALARAIIFDPELIMYDEPFTGLDPISKGVIVKLIKELNTALGMTSILVSHDVAETASIADHMFMISDSKIIAEGSPEELKQDKTPAVKQFIEGLADGAVPFHYPSDAYAEDLLT